MYSFIGNLFFNFEFIIKNIYTNEYTMGIKSFSQIFNSTEVKLKDLKNLTAAVDASIIAYQSSLGIKNINGLTDGDGNPTIHINVVIAKCVNFQKNKIGQRWVFDYHEKGYINPDKTLEVEKRNKRKDAAKKKLDELNKQKNRSESKDEKYNELFSSDDEDEPEVKTEAKDLESKIQTQERAGFTMNDQIINDIKFILDCFNIPWCVAPKGHEAESICAALTKDINSTADESCDLVWTNDTDAIIYGAKQMVREKKVKSKKIYMRHDLQDILEENKIDIDDLRKIAAIAGCDHCKKTPRIGPKTILKKFREVELNDDQKKATKVFAKTYDIAQLQWNNNNTEIFGDKIKITKLLNWLAGKNFNRERILKQLDPVIK